MCGINVSKDQWFSGLITIKETMEVMSPYTQNILDTLQWKRLPTSSEKSLVVRKDFGRIKENISVTIPNNGTFSTTSIGNIEQPIAIIPRLVNFSNTSTDNVFKWIPQNDQKINRASSFLSLLTLTPSDEQSIFKDIKNTMISLNKPTEMLSYSKSKATKALQNNSNTSTEITILWTPPNNQKVTYASSLMSLFKLPARDEQPKFKDINNTIPSPNSPTETPQPFRYFKDTKTLVSHNSTRRMVFSSGHNADQEIDCHSLVPKIKNITALINLSCQIDLNKVKLLPCAYYDPGSFSAAVTMRLPEPKTTGLIFPSGKIVCTGAESIESSKKALRKYARVIQNLGYTVRLRNFEVKNLVAGYCLPYEIDLQHLMSTLAESGIRGDYAPEVFPGLKYKTGIGKICAKVFKSGKVIITGAINMDEVKEAFEKIYSTIKTTRRAFPMKNSNDNTCTDSSDDDSSQDDSEFSESELQ